MKKKKAVRFPTLPCIVTAIVAVLLAIGFTWPFAAEASWDSGKIVTPNYPIPVPPDEKEIMRPSEAKIVSVYGLSRYALKDDRPLDIPRPDDEGKDKGRWYIFVDDKPFDFERISVPPAKASGRDCAGPCDGAGDYVLKSAGPSDEDGPGGFAPRDRIGVKPDGPYVDESTAFGCRRCIESVATQKMFVGVKTGGLNPDGPYLDESGDLGPPSKTKAKIILLGVGIDHHH